jgi:hypothetical protein
LRTLTLEHLIRLIKDYAAQTSTSVDLLLIGGLAMAGYGYPDRSTIDVDGELQEGVRTLRDYLSGHGIPSNLGQNISGWSIVAMPPGYRDRSTVLVDEPHLRIRLLAPVDFIIAKLRRGTEEDLDDAALVAGRFRITPDEIRRAATSAIAASLEDTALFLFEQTVQRFCERLDAQTA